MASTLVDSLRNVSIAFGISGSHWDGELQKAIEELRLPLGRRGRRKAENDTESKGTDIEALKVAALLILYGSPQHRFTLNGSSRSALAKLIRATAIIASQPLEDAFRASLGKAQSRMVKIAVDRRSMVLAASTLASLLNSSPNIEILISAPAIQKALVETLNLVNCRALINTCTRLGLSSSQLRNCLISTLKSQAADKVISSSLVLSASSILEIAMFSERFVTKNRKLASVVRQTTLQSEDIKLLFLAVHGAFIACLEARSAASTELLTAFEAFFRCLSKDDLTHAPVNLLSACSKLLRRTPEYVLLPLSVLFENLTFDVSPYALQLIFESGLMETLRSDKSHLQILAKRLLEAIISQVSEPNVILKCLEGFHNPLSKGQLAKTHERLAYTEAISSLTHCKHISTADLLTFLTPFFDNNSHFVSKAATKSELQESVRHTSLQLTGRFLQLAGIIGSSAKAICDVYLSSLTDPKTSDRIRHSVILALSAALNGAFNSDRIDFNLLQPVVDAVMQTVINNATKPTNRLLCLDGLLVLFRAEKCHSTILAKHCLPAMVSIFSNVDSFLNSLSAIGKSSSAEIASHVQLINLIFNSSSFCGLPLTSADPVCNRIILGSIANGENDFSVLSINSHAGVHDSGNQFFRPFFRSVVALFTSLFERRLWGSNAVPPQSLKGCQSSTGWTNLQHLFGGFEDTLPFFRQVTHSIFWFIQEMHMLNQSNEATKIQTMNSSSESSSFLYIDTVPSSSSLRLLFSFVISLFKNAVIDDPSDDTMSVLTLAACHPIVGFIKTSESGTHNQKFVKCLMLQNRQLPKCSIKFGPNVSTLEKLFKLVVSSEIVPDLTGYQRALVNAMSLLDPKIALSIELNGQQLPIGFSHNEIMKTTASLGMLWTSSLPMDEMNSLTKEDVDIFFFPEGNLYVESGVYIAREVANSNIKMNKFERELYGDVAQEVAHTSTKKVVQPKGKAKGAGAKESGNKTKADIEREELELQSKRREKIRSRLMLVEFLNRSIGVLSDVNAAGIQDAIPKVVALILELFRNFIRRVDLLRPQFVPDALYLAALQKFPVPEQIIDLLRSVSAAKPLHRSAISLTQPITAYILMHPSQAGSVACSAALEFIVRQLEVTDPNIDADGAIRCLDSVLRAQPSQVGVASVALKAISSKLLVESLVKSFTMIGQHDDTAVRYSVVEALKQSRCCLVNANAFLYACKFDAQDKIVQTADEARTIFGLPLTMETLEEIFTFLKADSSIFQDLASIAYAKATKELQESEAVSLMEIMEALVAAYKDTSTIKYRIGLASALKQICKANLISREVEFKYLFSFLTQFAINDGSLSCSPGSKSAVLLRILESIGLEAISNVGGRFSWNMNALLEETYADQMKADGPNGGNRGAVDAAVALFLGAIAKFINSADPSVKKILSRLLERIEDSSAPTRDVQRSIADVMPPLVKSCTLSGQIQGKEMVDKLLQEALTSDAFVTRNGASLALAAVVKGLGIASMKENDLIRRLIEAAEDKQDAVRRQGALLCFESLSEVLGRLFEPYVVQVLGTLLNSLSDGAQPVRASAQKAANVIMGHLSAHGVKLVLPNLLKKVADKQWRTKLGSIELLGAMAHCAPKQLAALLPQVVPQLCDVVSDPNAKVKEATKEALGTIASVIANKEIRNMSSILLNALTQPSNETARAALEALLGTQFVNPVDSPSLALICPIVVRALRERGSETKKKAAAIVASMVYLCNEPADFLPYFSQICPQLQETLLDPIPDVRSVAAKALGTIAKGLGDENLGGLLPWLLEKLKSQDSSVERAGAASGLSEVLAALGVDKLKDLLPSILQNAEHAPTEIREGYLGLFVFLPGSFGGDFQCFVPEVLPVLLRGLSSEVESLREVAFRASEVLVVQYGATHTVLLLTPLEDGVFHSNWRIRYSSVSLLGTLVDRLLRFVPGPRHDLLDTEVLSVERRAFILSSLYVVRSDESPIVRQSAINAWKSVVQNTPKTLKEILPILLKRLVSHLCSASPEKQRVAARCIGELSAKMPDKVLPELMASCLDNLKKPGVAGRHGACLGLSEMLQHAPKSHLSMYSSKLIPAIQETLCDESNAVRQASTDCFRYLLDALGQASLSDIVADILVSITVPPTFRIAEVESGIRAAQLSGVEVLIDTQTQSLLPPVLAQCTSFPYDLSKIRLMSCVASVRNVSSLQRCLPKLIPGLIEAGVAALRYKDIPPNSLEGIKDSSILEDFDSAILLDEIGRTTTKLFKKVPEEGRESLIDLLTQTLLQKSAPLGDLSATGRHKIAARLIELGLIKSAESETTLTDQGILETYLEQIEKNPTNPFRRAMIIELIDTFMQTSGVDIVDFAPQIFTCIIPLALCDPSSLVQEKAVQAFITFASLIKRTDPSGQVGELRNVMCKVITDPVTGKEDKDLILPGLGKKNALDTFYSLYHSGLVAGEGLLKELSARGLSDLFTHCPPESLKGVAVKLTGPLIRGTAERVPPPVKASLLNALRVLLIKAGPALRPLLPQLQISFVKAIPDPSAAVRKAAASGLGCLAELPSTRTEALITELCSSVNNQIDPAVKASVLHALRDVLGKLPQSCSDAAQIRIMDSTSALLYNGGRTVESLRAAATECLGALLARHIGLEKLELYLNDQLERSINTVDTDVRQGGAMLLAEIVRFADIWKETETRVHDLLARLIESVLVDERTNIRRLGIVAYGHVVTLAKMSNHAQKIVFSLLKPASTAISSFSSATSISALQGGLKTLKRLAKFVMVKGLVLEITQRVQIIMPALSSLSLPHPAVKLQAERILFYALEISNGNDTNLLTQLQLTKLMDTARFNLLSEYARRVLIKMSKIVSDSEED